MSEGEEVRSQIEQKSVGGSDYIHVYHNSFMSTYVLICNYATKKISSLS